MKLGSLFVTSTFVTGLLAAPTVANKVRDFNADELIAAIDDFTATIEEQALSKRDNEFVEGLISKLSSSNLNDLIDRLDADQISNQVFSSLGSFNISYLAKSFDGETASSFFSSMFNDKETFSQALDLAKNYFNGDTTTTKSTKSKKRSVEKRENEYVDKIVQSLGDSDLIKSATDSILNNPDLKDMAGKILEKTIQNVDISTLFNTIKLSDILSELSSELLTTRDFKEEFSNVVNDKIKRGIIKRDELTDQINSLAAAQAGSSAIAGSSATSVPLLDDDTTSDTTTATADEEATTSGGSFLDGLFGDNDSESTTEDATTSTSKESTETDGSFLDDLFGDDSESTSEKATTTSSSKESTKTGGSFLDGLGDLLNPSNATTTSSSAQSTSTGSPLSDLLGSLFNTSDSDSSSKNSSSSGGFSLDGFLDDLFNSTGESTPSTPSNFSLSGLIDGLLDDIFDVDSSNSTKSGGDSDFSFGDLISGLFDDLFGGSDSNSTSSSGDFSLSGFLGNLLDSLFGGSSDSSSGSGSSGSGGSIIDLLLNLAKSLFGSFDFSGIFDFVGRLINRFLDWLFSGNLTNFSWGNLIDWILDSLFDDDGSSSSSVSSSSGSSSGSSVAQQCCCNKKMIKKRALKAKFKRNIHKNIHKKAAELKKRLYINLL